MGIKNPGDSANFSATFDNLFPNTRYFIRAYAQVKQEAFYSETAEIITRTAMVITEGFAYESGRNLLINGRITDLDAGITAINHGFCWSTSNTTPTLDDAFVDLGSRRTGSTFTYRVDSLINNTNYYLRAYATLLVNGILGTSYGEVLTFDGNLKDVWDLKSEVPVTASGFGSSFAVFTIEDQVYVYASGIMQADSFTTVFLAYDPKNNLWTEKSKLSVLGGGMLGFSAGNRGYLHSWITGTGPDIFRDARSLLRQYDPATDTWIERAAHPGYIRQSAIAIGTENSAYLGFGVDPFSSFAPSGFSDWWEFNPGQNCDEDPPGLPGCWTEKKSLSPHGNGFGRYNPIGIAINNRIFAGLGINNTVPTSAVIWQLNDWWEFNPTTNTWTEKSKFIGEIGKATTAFGLAEKGYVYAVDNTFWEYTPAIDRWTEKEALPIEVNDNSFNAEGFVVDGRGYLLTYSNAGKSQIWQYDQE